ncbi:MAG: MFS transporter [Spirochaetaceae bacterium]|nr:MFS transporter [Spirochaetaceae bacterium]
MKNLTGTERSWVFYDWANSVHSTVISTAIFPLWFGQVAMSGGLSRTQTSAWLGAANTGYAVIVALMAAVLGTLSDFKGYRKKLFTQFWLLGVIATGALVFVGADAWVIALVLYVLTFIGFAGANIFYDASLPDVTTPGRMDMVSSMGFGYGYIGGSTIPFLISLAIIAVLSGMDFSGGLPLLGVKISFGLTAVWWFLFTIPFLKNVKQKNGIDPVPSPVIESVRRLGRTFLQIRKHKKIFLFLIAYFFYIDGVNTIIKMATNFANSIDVGMMILLATVVGIQILAFPFALLYGKLANRFSARSMLFVGIGVYSIITGLGVSMPLVPVDAVVPIFIAVAFLVATSQGGIQALSRSYFASLIPDDNASGEFFGFYNMMGKFAAILGPFLMGAFPRLAFVLGIANERVAYSFGVGAIFLLFLVGGVLLVASGKPVKKA